MNDKREKINKWRSDNIVVECCCLVQARLLIKYKGHRNHLEKRVMQIIVYFSNKALILHCEWISVREKMFIFFLVFFHVYSFKGRIFNPYKAKHFSWKR